MPKTVQNYVEEGLVSREQVENCARTLISKNNAIWVTTGSEVNLLVVDRIDYSKLTQQQQLNLIDILMSATASVDEDCLCH